MSPQRHTRFTSLGRTLVGEVLSMARLPHGLLCLALLLLGTSPHSAHAARRVALLIGNGQYQHETVLPNPVRDVALLERTLTQLGFTVDKLENLDKRGMELAINRFASKTAGADTALVFYAGHGTQPSKGGRSFLLPVNAQVSDDETLETDGVPADDIASKLERTSNPAKLRLVILDACRSRKTSRGADRGLAPPKPTDDYTLIAYSTNDGETADDGKGANSPYAQALAKLLPRLKTEPVRVVFEETAREVRAATGHKQKPRTYGDLESRVGLDGVQVASVVPVATGLPVQVQPQADPEQEAWEIAKRRDTVASYGVYLNRYPSGRYAQTARDALEGLQPTTTATPTPAAWPVQPAVVQAASPAPPPPAQASLQPGQAFRDCTGAHCPEMVVIPAGSFVMGSNDDDSEKPPHRVSVRSFALGKYEVTQGQWKAVMGSNPSGFKDCGDNCPVEEVTWDVIQQYLGKLNGMTGMKYRLASEAEWEYAARAGSTGKWSFGDNESALGQYAWFGGNSNKQTQPVGQKQANAFGLHDMHGNVWEWVQDCSEVNYSKGQPRDGSAHKGNDRSCTLRVLRGGSWDFNARNTRAANRKVNSPNFRVNDYGFRVARTVP